MRKRQFHNFDLKKEKAANELKMDAMNMIIAVYKDKNMTTDAKSNSLSCLIAATVQAVDKIKAI